MFEIPLCFPTLQAVGGIFAAVANIITIAVGGDVAESGFIFFLIATGWTLITLLGYLSLYSNVSEHAMVVMVIKQTINSRNVNWIYLLIYRDSFQPEVIHANTHF